MFYNLYLKPGCDFWHLEENVNLGIIWANGGKYKETGWEGLWTYTSAPHVRKTQSMFINQETANLSWERDGILSYIQWSMKCKIDKK